MGCGNAASPLGSLSPLQLRMRNWRFRRPVHAMNPHARADEKLNLWLHWIARFHVSTHPIYARLLGLSAVDAGHHYAFHQRLVTRGLLTRVQVPGRVRPFSLYALTGAAHRNFVLPGSPLSPAALSRYVGRAEFAHDLAVQWYIAGQPSASAVATADPVVWPRESVRPDGVLPEADPIAVEVELQQKTESRIYRTFLAHAESIARGRFAHVRYVFVNDALRRNYVKRFDAVEWPHYHYEAASKRYRALPEPYAFPTEHPLRSRFTFEVQPLWPLTSFLPTT